MSKVKMVRSLAAAAVGVVGLLAATGTAHADDVPEVNDEIVVGFDSTSSEYSPTAPGTYNFVATYSGDANSAAMPGSYQWVATYSGDAN